MLELPVEGSDTRVGEARPSTYSSKDRFLSSLRDGTIGPLVIAAGPTFAYMLFCLTLFLILRRIIPRVYSPKTMWSISIHKSCAIDLPDSWISWMTPLFRLPECYILAGCHLDGFLFLRYLKILCVICFIGIVLAWPVLLPIHATGSSLSPLDSLTIQSLDDVNKFYAHVAISWVFTCFVLYIVWRESLYFINLRHAYLSSSGYYERKTSRTILITSVPESCLEEKLFRKLFGDSVVRCWIPKATGRLKKLIKKREKRAHDLEEARIALINETNQPRISKLRFYFSYLDRVRRARFDSNDVEIGQVEERTTQPTMATETQPRYVGGHDMEQVSRYEGVEYPYTCESNSKNGGNDLDPSIFTSSQSPKRRHLGRSLRLVDMIGRAESDLKLLNEKIEESRRNYHSDVGTDMNAVFIEFDSVANAQAALQSIAQYQPLQMCRQVIGARPGDIVWSCLGITWRQRLVREFLVVVILAPCVILWIIPVTIVNLLTSSSLVEEHIPGTSQLPQIAINVISGLGRSLLMILLQEVMPYLMRACAKLAGVPTLSAAESFVHTRYFVFQALQIFLAPIIAPADKRNSSHFFDRVVPEANSLYLTYILVRCLSVGATDLAQFWELFRHLTRSKDAGTPRTTYERFHDLSIVHWGSAYPVVTNIAVIAISYACIAPLILVFALVGLGFVYVVYKYTLFHIYDTETLDTTGRFYTRALMQILVGLYLAQIYFIGLFVVSRAWGPFALILLLSIFTVFMHVSLRSAMSPRLECLNTLKYDDGSIGVQQLGLATSERPHLDPEDDRPSFIESSSDVQHAETLEETSSSITNEVPSIVEGAQRPVKRHKRGNWFRTHTPEDMRAIQRLIPYEPKDDESLTLYEPYYYLPPEIWVPKPKLWLPKNNTMSSYQQTSDTEEALPIFDSGARVDEEGQVDFNIELAPFRDDLLLCRHLRLVL